MPTPVKQVTVVKSTSNQVNFSDQHSVAFGPAMRDNKKVYYMQCTCATAIKCQTGKQMCNHIRFVIQRSLDEIHFMEDKREVNISLVYETSVLWFKLSLVPDGEDVRVVWVDDFFVPPFDIGYIFGHTRTSHRFLRNMLIPYLTEWAKRKRCVNCQLPEDIAALDVKNPSTEAIFRAIQVADHIVRSADSKCPDCDMGDLTNA